MRYKPPLALIVVLLIGLVITTPSQYAAQEITPEATETPSSTTTLTPTYTPTLAPLSVTRSEPMQMVAGQATTLSVLGTNFTTSTAVRLVGVGLLPVTLINSSALTVSIPATILPGVYAIEVSDPARGVQLSPDTLTILAPTATPLPLAPTLTPRPFETLPAPTPVPGEPSLLVRNYTVNPTTITPGSRFTATVELFNQGSRTAQGVSVSIGSGERFAPATGQGAVLLPDIVPGGSAIATLSIVASQNVTNGPNSVQITLLYRDFEAKTYTVNTSLTVNAAQITEVSQLILARYRVDPNPVIPGNPVTLTVLITNSGSDTATQVLLRVTTGADSVLLPGAQGDSFPLGDIAPGASISLAMPLIASAGADAGPRLQPLTIAFLKGTETEQVNTAITIEVSEIQAPTPLFLLESYTTDTDELQPGDRFTLSLTLINVGTQDANDVLITFGSVEPPRTSGTSTPNALDPDTPSNSSSETFAPIDAGGTRFIEQIAANGGELELSQNFVVDGSVDSGIYNLPITLRYTRPDGTITQETLRASIVVIVPPRLRVLRPSIPATLNAGEPLPLTLELVNFGRSDINLTFANFLVTSENGEVVEGAESFVGLLRSGETTPVEAAVLGYDEGTLTLELRLNYLDDFDQEQTLTETLTFEIVAFTPPDDFFPEEPSGETPVIEEEPAPGTGAQDWLGRFLLGFLGLGS